MAARKKLAAPSDRMQQLADVAKRFEGWSPASEVLTEVEAVPTIFPQLDIATRCGGLPLQRVVLIHGPSNHGKAEPVDSKVLTPEGWARFGDLRAGDFVIGSDGRPTEVLGIYPQGVRPVFRVVTRAGESRCCAEHLWFTTTKNEAERGKFVRAPRSEGRARIATGVLGDGSVKSLAEIAETLDAHHVLPRVQPVHFRALMDVLPCPAYILGLLLGDGSMSASTVSFAKPDAELHEVLRAYAEGLGDACRYKVDKCPTTFVARGAGTFRAPRSALASALMQLGLMGTRSHERFVPEAYKMASPEARLELLRGLFDTDGYNFQGTLVDYVTTSERLALDVAFVARSLGASVRMSTKESHYTSEGERYPARLAHRLAINFADGTCPFKLERKARGWKSERKQYGNVIEQVIPDGEAECQCIRVAAEDHLYVTEDFLLTHNTLCAHGLGLSFLQAGSFYQLIDAEFTTDMTWLRSLMGPYANHPGFVAMRPTTYEATVEAVRNGLNVLQEARAKGDLPPDTSSLIVVDSLKKLVPDRIVAKIAEEKGGIDGMAGMAAMYKAALNAAWLDELVPLLYHTRATLVLIGRESEKVDAQKYEAKWKLSGGKAIFFDSSLVMRVTRADWVTEGSKENRRVLGERHEIDIVKTKVGGKDDKSVAAYFHSSNGVECPEGFDRARDVVELAVEHGLFKKSGSTLVHAEFGDSWRSVNECVRYYRTVPDELAALEVACRTLAAEAVQAGRRLAPPASLSEAEQSVIMASPVVSADTLRPPPRRRSAS